MKMIHVLCFTYAFTQDKKYMDKAEEFLLAWAAINKCVVKRNIHEEAYTQAVCGYSLIRRLLSAESRATIDKWATDRINVMKGTPDLRINNWGTCLLTQYYIYGYVLDRKDWVEDVKKTYPEWVKTNLYPNGTTTDLLGRDAFAYHAYDLLFFARLCHVKAIYEGYEAATKFYNQDVNWGASIKKCVDYWLPFFLDPDKNYHMEFVETEWRGDKDRGDYGKKYNPMSTLYVMDELYEFDPDLQGLMDKYRKGYTEKAMISALRYLK